MVQVRPLAARVPKQWHLCGPSHEQTPANRKQGTEWNDVAPLRRAAAQAPVQRFGPRAGWRRRGTTWRACGARQPASARLRRL